MRVRRTAKAVTDHCCVHDDARQQRVIEKGDYPSVGCESQANDHE